MNPVIPRSVRLTQPLFYMIGAIWLGLAAAAFVDGGWLISILMVGNGVVLAIIGFGLNKRPKIFFYAGMVVLSINILLTFTDQFGIWDLTTVMIDLVGFILLLLNRKYYLR